MNFLSSISIFYLLNVIMALAIIFLERKDPIATLAWVLVLLLLPGVGFVLYLLLSPKLNTKKLFAMTIYAKNIFNDYLKCQQDFFNSESISFYDKNIELYKDIIKMNLFTNMSSFTQNNDVKVFIDGNDKFEELFNSMEMQKNIFM